MKGAKTGGREKGTPNVTTKKVRQYFLNLVEDNLEQLKSDLMELNPQTRIKYIIELSKFVLPTLKSTDLIINDADGITPFDVRKLWEQ
jgi:hypothetical protein